MGRTCSLDLRERVVAAVAAGGKLSIASCDLQGGRCQCGEMVAAFPGNRERSGAQGWWQAALCVAGTAELASGPLGREAGHPSYDLPECFERTQQIFEMDLADLLRRREAALLAA
jgi:hypothetical protein